MQQQSGLLRSKERLSICGARTRGSLDVQESSK
jgi:hypothetical protein